MNDLIHLDKNIRFIPKPIATPFGARLSNKIPLICLVIFHCARSSCSLTKLQIIVNSLNCTSDYEKLMSFSRDGSFYVNLVVRYDPLINKALLFAIKDGLIVEQKNGKYRLTTIGKEFVAAIIMEDILMNETKKLKELSISLTDNKIENMYVDWGK